MDGDLDIDLAVTNQDADSVAILLNNGDGTFELDATYLAGDQPRSVIVVDLNDDQDLDLVTSNEESNTISVLINNGDGSFSAQVEYVAGNEPRTARPMTKTTAFRFC